MKRRIIKKLKKALDQRPIATALLTAAVLMGAGAGVSNLQINSLLQISSNPLASAQADITYPPSEIDEAEATDGTGLEELTTVGARQGATVSWIYQGSTAPSAGVKMTHELRSGSPTQSLPHIILPDDNGSSSLYWELVSQPKVVGGAYLLQDLNASSTFYRIGVRNTSGGTTLEAGNTAITIDD